MNSAKTQKPEQKITPAQTREAWLARALPHLKKLLYKAGGQEFPDPQFSIGLPSKGALQGKRIHIGECWTEKAHLGGKKCTIFISPILADPVAVLDVAVHELVHACVGVKKGHNAVFGRLARAVGLIGPLRSTEAGPELKKYLTDLAAKLGTFHHDALKRYKSPVKKQTTRQRLYECDCCEKKVRVASDEFLAMHYCDNDLNGRKGLFVLKSSPNLPE